MPPRLALLLFSGFILWLFVENSRRRKNVSFALWIPFFWMAIIGTRFVSVWLGSGDASASSDAYVEGSPLDRAVFLLLIVAGLVVVIRRRVTVASFVQQNKLLFVLFLYFGISASWSDFPFVSFKRWIKDLGNIIMVLVVLSERDRVEAIKSLLARITYVAIPLSVLFNKYFPELSRYYDQWTHRPFFSGVATDKNLLGMTLFVCGVYLCWNLFDLRRDDRSQILKRDVFVQLTLMSMTLWLLNKANSSTALACTVLGGCLIVLLHVPFFRRHGHRVGTYAICTSILVVLLNSAFNLSAVVVGLLGRDLTLTGRTEIWAAVLAESTDPLFGDGFYSFWMGDRVERLSAQYYHHLNSAHNTYLETYLNTGLIGVLLIVLVLAVAARRIGQDLKQGSEFAIYRLAVLMSTAVYGMTEAIFNRLGLTWFMLLLVVTEYGRSNIPGSQDESPQPRSDREEELPDSTPAIVATN
jgi:exopolysaccharide production protein ExoQ